MRLRITSLGAIAVDEPQVVSVRAEDASGSFGILDRHADFLTALDTSVISWRRADGTEGHCAVRRGVLTVEAGERVSVATREAVVDADLGEFRAREAAETAARVETARVELRAVREILRYLRPERVRYEGAGSERGVSPDGDPG
jgi:F-type H+-transporting ATPase subunit epsilon